MNIIKIEKKNKGGGGGVCFIVNKLFCQKSQLVYTVIPAYFIPNAWTMKFSFVNDYGPGVLNVENY